MKKLVAVMLIIIGAFIFWYFNISQYLTLTALQQESAYLKDLVDQYSFLSALVFVLAYAIVIACGLPAAAPFTILGGFLFGVFVGFLYALIGATLGSVVYFLLIRYALTNMVRASYVAQLNRFNERVKKYGYSYLLTLHWLSVVPYFVINTLAALADVPLLTFVWTTLFGSSPLLFVYAFAGRELNVISSVRDILRPDVIILLVLLALLALLPMVIRKFRKTIEP